MRVGIEFLDLGTNAVELLRGGLAGELQIVRHDRAVGRRRAVAAGRIESGWARWRPGSHRRWSRALAEPFGPLPPCAGQGSNPSFWPAFRLDSIQALGGLSTRCSIVNSWGRSGREPGAYNGRRRTATALSARIMAAPADPVKPVSQASRSSLGGRYSFWKRSACGTTKPSRPAALQLRPPAQRVAAPTPTCPGDRRRFGTERGSFSRSFHS